jgi:hypothetical protein
MNMIGDTTNGQIVAFQILQDTGLIRPYLSTDFRHQPGPAFFGGENDMGI